MTQHREELEVHRVIRAPLERVFDAWTDPALIVKWWGAGGVVCTAAEMDLSLGGTYRIKNQTPDGTTMWITGTFGLVDPPNRLSYSWAMEPLEVDTVFSQVDVRFDEHAEGTLVTVRHERIVTPEDREVNLQGWLGCLEGLDHLLLD